MGRKQTPCSGAKAARRPLAQLAASAGQWWINGGLALAQQTGLCRGFVGPSTVQKLTYASGLRDSTTGKPFGDMGWEGTPWAEQQKRAEREHITGGSATAEHTSPRPCRWRRG